MAVITVSRQAGSMGHRIAREISNDLRYSYVDKRLMARVISRMTIFPNDIARLKEDEKIFGTLITGISELTRQTVQGSFVFTDREKRIVNWLDTNAALPFVKRVVRHFGREGNSVVVGRGSQFILQDFPGVIHIRLLASMEYRINHLRENHYLRQDDATLRQRIKSEDHRRREFLKTHFKESGEDPLLYHMVINRSKIPKEKEQDMILQLIE